MPLRVRLGTAEGSRTGALAQARPAIGCNDYPDDIKHVEGPGRAGQCLLENQAHVGSIRFPVSVDVAVRLSWNGQGESWSGYRFGCAGRRRPKCGHGRDSDRNRCGRLGVLDGGDWTIWDCGSARANQDAPIKRRSAIRGLACDRARDSGSRRNASLVPLQSRWPRSGHQRNRKRHSGAGLSHSWAGHREGSSGDLRRCNPCKDKR